MTLYEKIVSICPTLTALDFFPMTGTIVLRNDSDGRGDYIAEWNHPVYPKPTEEQLAEVTK